MKIILPDSEKAEFDYFIVTAIPNIHTAMVKFPATLKEPVKGKLDEENQLMWFLTERRDEVDDDDESEASRYELRGALFDPRDLEPQQPDPSMDAKELNEFIKKFLNDFLDKLESDSFKDGYVYFPKATRDGRHEDRYILQPIDKEHFTTRTERGMFEEVAWSPFGSIAEATKQEAQNLERNPLMRNWI
jgi:hypothetical protein